MAPDLDLNENMIRRWVREFGVSRKMLFPRKLTQMVNKLKIETSISLRMRDEEVEIHGKSNCWDIGRR